LVLKEKISNFLNTINIIVDPLYTETINGTGSINQPAAYEPTEGTTYSCLAQRCYSLPMVPSPHSSVLSQALLYLSANKIYSGCELGQYQLKALEKSTEVILTFSCVQNGVESTCIATLNVQPDGSTLVLDKVCQVSGSGSGTTPSGTTNGTTNGTTPSGTTPSGHPKVPISLPVSPPTNNS
jgi:hypothetical protein